MDEAVIVQTTSEMLCNIDTNSDNAPNPNNDAYVLCCLVTMGNVMDGRAEYNYAPVVNKIIFHTAVNNTSEIKFLCCFDPCQFIHFIVHSWHQMEQ